jgi:hypothetical protein
MRLQNVGLAVLLLVLLPLVPAGPSALACGEGAASHERIAGVYASVPYQLRVEIDACGDSTVQWTQYRPRMTHHVGQYRATERLPQGGVALRAVDGERFEESDLLGVHPRDDGGVLVMTMAPEGEVLGVYRLDRVE